MNMTPQCLLKIKQVYPDLNGKYRDIADYILGNPEKIVRNKARDIARDCNCDDSQIIRFCQKIGFSGFSELKVSIASEFMPVAINVAEKESVPGDSFSRIRQNFLDNNMKVLQDTIRLFNEKDIAETARLLSEAKTIYLLGSGVSGFVAGDLQVKLIRLGFHAVFHPDSSLNRMFLGLVNPDDVVVAISFSGENRDVCDLAGKAGKIGAPVIAITNFPNSRLAGVSSLTLLTASDEKVFRLGAMTSRIAQQLVLDFLIIYLAMQNMDRSEENVLRTHEMIDQ